jgi:hypothetical protein
MADSLDTGQKQALEACIHDTVSFMSLFAKAQQHPQSALLFHGMVPYASMYVVESYRCLTKIFPELQSVLSSEHPDLLHASRHRAKLLDNAQRSIEEVTGELVTIAVQQRQSFLGLHHGFLGTLKRLVQPDMGLSTYNGHMFSTTHSTIFGFGEGCDFNTSAFAFGKAMGAYTASLLNLFQLEMQMPPAPAPLPDTIEMRDIKFEALYNRGPFGTCGTRIAAGLALLLANLNYTHYILRGMLSTGGHTFFRLKFIVAFHATANIKAIQDRLASTTSASTDTRHLFRDALGNMDSRWLRKRDSLRNLLTHYLADPQTVAKLPSGATRVDAIEYLGGLSFNEIDTLLDRYIAHLANILESGFCLSGDPFWYGQVS